MRRFLRLFLAGFIAVLAISGCSQRAQSASEAISQSKSMATVEEQAQYLVKQANQFVNSQQFDEAIEAARYVLNKLDSGSQEAKAIMEKAETGLKKLASQKLDDVKSSLGNLGQ